MSEVDDLRDRYVAELPRYEQLCRLVRIRIEAIALRAGVPVVASARPKGVGSLVKKTLRPNHPYESIRDKAAARAVVTFPEHKRRLREAIQTELPGVSPDDKAEQLGEDRFTYSGVHWDIQMPVAAWPETAAYAGLFCELQLQTQAERLWSDLDHDVIYKPRGVPASEAAKRRTNRLMALCEIIDSEIELVRTEMKISASPALAILANLEEEYFRFAPTNFDRALSFDVLEALLPALGDDYEAYLVQLHHFVAANSEKLAAVFEDARDREASLPLLFQPESLVVFHLLEKDRFTLEDRWQYVLPVAELESLARFWGHPIR